MPLPTPLHRVTGPRRSLLALLAVALVAALVYVTPFLSVPRPANGLEDLRGVDELGALFDADAGQTRLVLLLAPT
jgi:hypothetical protein